MRESRFNEPCEKVDSLVTKRETMFVIREEYTRQSWKPRDPINEAKSLCLNTKI